MYRMILLILLQTLSFPCLGQQAAELEKPCLTVKFAGGRLGNQLFEVATVLSLAKDLNCTPSFPMLTKPKWWGAMRTYGFPRDKMFSRYIGDESIFSVGHLGEFREYGGLDSFPNSVQEDPRASRESFIHQVEEKLPAVLVGRTASSTYSISSAALRVKKGWGMLGFVSHKLFSHNMEYIQEKLGPNDTQKNHLIEKFEGLGLPIVGKNNIAIHVRRGDRQELKWKMIYPSVGIKFYKKAIRRVEQELKQRKEKIDRFVVFSDDPVYVENQFKREFSDLYEKGMFFFVDFRKHNQQDYEDLWLMSLLNHNIIGNSTFSIWSALLNKNPDKIVIEPLEFLGPLVKYLGLQYKNQGITPDHWIKL